jgi:hypothetical protein
VRARAQKQRGERQQSNSRPEQNSKLNAEALVCQLKCYATMPLLLLQTALQSNLATTI